MFSRNAIMLNIKATDVILHAFDWPYKRVTQRAQLIAEAGYKAVLVSPPMKSESHRRGTPWWQRYQPQDYRVIENQLGDTRDFKKMVAALQANDLWPYVDVVFNHMANESNIRSDLQYPSAPILKRYEKKLNYYRGIQLFGDLSQPLFNDHEFVDAFSICNWYDPWQVQHGRISGGPHDRGLPTLAPTERVIRQQREYLRAMKALGVKGFRIDAAKHMTMDHLQQVWSSDITDDVHIFGEIITDGGATAEEYRLFLKPYLEHTELGAYDFPLFQTVFNAFKQSGDLTTLVNPYCFGQALSPTRAITFAVTHDIPNNTMFNGLIMEDWAEDLAYSYLLGRDGGVPLIYTDLLRNKSGAKPQPSRWYDVWNDKAMVAKITFHNQMHGLEMEFLTCEPDLLAFARGDKGVVVLNKSEHSQLLVLDRPQSLTDLITGKCFVVIDGKVHIEIAAKQSYMLVVAT
jgi:alpha-amylase